MSYSHKVDDALVFTLGFGATTVRKIMQVGVNLITFIYTHLHNYLINSLFTSTPPPLPPTTNNNDLHSTNTCYLVCVAP